MGIKEQYRTVKDNWLIAIVLIVLVVALSGGGELSQLAYKSVGMAAPMAAYDMEESAAYRGGGVYYDEGFAPEVTDRVITKSASLTTEVPRGSFAENAALAKGVITAADGYLLDENVNKYGPAGHQTWQGYYQIKVETPKYEAVVAQLKQIGEVQSFSESRDDITGRYTDAQVELEAEKARLERYQEMYDDAVKVEDKITLSDRIFDQERRVKYLEDRIGNMDQRVDYSTISLSIQEKQSDYVSVALVKISELVRSLVDSFNSLLTLLFVVVPWAVGIGIVWLVVRVFRKKRR
ncbi:DUF4349 domain-containing protein [Candidatus Woesearchaeota archaeon]|nr:DUF4349 domain-containing protein [Candidatus Woesearchaeota archaeon]